MSATSPHRCIVRRAAGAALAVCLIGLGACETDPAPPTTFTQAQLTPPDLPKARQLALRAQKTSDINRATRLYQEAIAAYPGFGAALNNLGVLLMEQERYLEAASAFAAAAEAQPTDPRPMYNLGLAWDRTSHMEKAHTIYLRALSRDPSYLPALRGAIKTERLLGRAEAATLQRIEAAMLADPDAEWREYFTLQRSRVLSQLEKEDKPIPRGTGGILPERLSDPGS